MIEPWAAPLLIALAVLAFYALPLFAPEASIHGDTLDVQYPMQRVFAEHLDSGRLPYWSPYILSGYPLLANPESQAWYLPHWWFYVFWLTPRAVEFEIALNALLACLGAYLLFRDSVNRSFAAILGAMLYGLSGFFAAHSTQLTIFAAAAWLPWLLWAYRRAVDSSGLKYVAMGGFAGGCMILAGNLPAAVFGFAALGSYVAVTEAMERHFRFRAFIFAAGIAGLAICFSAIQLLPAMELIRHSRLADNYSAETLRLSHLLTLILPDAAGSIAGKDSGSGANHYFYGSLLLLPLAVNGARNRRIALSAGALVAPGLWYMLGPSGGLYWLGGLVPAMQKMGPPNVAWFVPALGLAWLAAAGYKRLFTNFPYAGLAVIALCFADLWFWNIYSQPLAFARSSPDQMLDEHAERKLTSVQPPLTRFDAPGPLARVGPELFPLYMKFETTTGYLSFKPEIYLEYQRTIARNPRLREGLNALRYLDAAGNIQFSSNALPRAYFPRTVRGVHSEAESIAALSTLIPAEQSTVLAPNYILQQDRDSDVFIFGYDERSYGIHYRARTPSLLKLAVAWYPGWEARVAGRSLPILRVDHALLGVVVPPGDGAVEFRFSSRYFARGLLITLIAWLGASVMIWGGPLWTRLTTGIIDR